MLALAGTAASGANDTFANTLVGFGSGNAIDLHDFDYRPGATTVSRNGDTLTVEASSQGRKESFNLTDSGSGPFATADDGHGGTLVGVATTGQVSSTAGAAYDPDHATAVPLVVYGGTGLSYTATTATVDGHVVLTIGNGIVGETIDLGAGKHAVELDFSANEAAVTLTGGAYGDSLKGGAGKDILDGGRGVDHMAGGNGRDTYLVRDSGDVITETASGGVDTVKATVSYTLVANVERLFLAGTANIDGTGSGAANYVTGNTGNNHIDGGGGHDILTGLGGSDTFVFSTALGPNNVARITDFAPSNDMIGLGDSIFTGLHFTGPNGTLDPNEFVSLSAAEISANTKYGADVHILYREDKGALYYDSDGYGGEKAIAFAVLDGKPALSAADFTSHHDVLMT